MIWQFSSMAYGVRQVNRIRHHLVFVHILLIQFMSETHNRIVPCTGRSISVVRKRSSSSSSSSLWKMCFLLASTIPFFVTLLFCRLCKFIELLEIFNFYRILLLETCARFLSFLPCIFIVIASFYRFSLVLSF